MSLSTTQYGYIVDPMVPFTDDKGKTIKNGFIRVFMAGTSTPVLTYRNYDGATNQEKIELDNSGRVKHNVIGSKGSLYKVVVYDAHHSQETPILTVDKIAVLGASINATGATIVTGLDSVTVQEENFLKATVEGTGVELALDPTEVTSELSTIGAAETAAPDYVVPLLEKTGTEDGKKISLANLFKFALDWISRLATTITSFASGDYFAVSNPTDGTRKMSKDTLLELTAQNALGSIHSLTDPATESDVASENYFALDGSQATKKLPSWMLAKYSSVCAKMTGAPLTMTGTGSNVAAYYAKKWHNGRHGVIEISISETVATFTEIRVYVAENANLSGANKLVGKVLYSDFVADKMYSFYFENVSDYNYVVIRGMSLNGTVSVSSTCYEEYVFIEDFQDRPAMEKLVVDSGTNKAANLVWTSGYEVYRSNLNKLRVTTSYSVVDISVKKGDVLIYTYDRQFTETAAAISRKLSDGTSTSAYQPLTPPEKASSYFYIFEEDMDVTLCKSNSGTVTLEWYESANNKNILDFGNKLFVRFRPENIANIVKPMKRNPTSGAIAKQKPLTLLHFSDIHDNLAVPYHIKDFMAKYGDYVDDVICTGDMTGRSFVDYRPVYDLAGFNKWLLCIGNHDVYDHNGDATSHGVGYDDPAYWATDSEKYQQYFANNIAGWDVTYTANKCYYYKDYDLTSGADSSTVSTLRLIVLDAMSYDAAQHSWLESVLTDAKTNGYAVVIADHFPPTETDAGDYTLFDTPFASKMTGMEMWYGLTRLGYLVGDTRYTAANLVDDFIDAGGEFVCWLCGHLHYAQVGTLNSHPRQIFIAIETGSTNPVWSDVPRVDLDDSEDLFNLVNIDTFNKVIRVARVGAKYDYLGRMRSVMSVDYANRTLIS